MACSLLNKGIKACTGDIIGILNSDDIYFSELRHYKCLENINIKLDLALNNIQEIEIASNFMDEALYELDNIFGRHDKEEELDIIFRKFCIGK